MSRSSGQFLQQEYERFVRAAGRLAEPHFASAVCAQVRLRRGLVEPGLLVAGGRDDEFGVQQPAVTGGAAARRADRHDHLVGEIAGQALEVLGQTHVRHRAGRVGGRAFEAAGNGQRREQALAPGDGVQQGDLLEAGQAVRVEVVPDVVEQHLPATSAGIHRGLPARADTSTSACGSEGCRCWPGFRPKMRLMQAGKYAAAAPSRSVGGSLRSWARGMGPGTDGMRSSLTTSRTAAVRPVSARTPIVRWMMSEAPIAARASFSAAAHRRAIISAARSRPGVDSARRNVFSSAAVLIWTGHGIAQLPSAAQVSMPSYSYSSCSRASSGDPSGWRAISRRSTIRCRGVVVTLRLGQTGSQKPHSMQCAATSSIGGADLNFFMLMPSSLVRITFGASTPCGSASFLIRHIMSVALSAHSRRTNGAMLMPVPCSAFSEPSYLSMISATRSVMNAAYLCRSPGSANAGVSVKCRLP